MSKGLEALNYLKHRFEIARTNQNELDTIEKELKAFAIICDHKLLNYVLKNEKCANMYHLQKEEIELLKEVVK